jgi:hypothetical protein
MTTAEAPLKRCPFCGEDSAHVRVYAQGCEVVCDNPDCDDMEDANWTREHAIEMWNSRPIEDALQVKVDALTDVSRHADKFITALLNICPDYDSALSQGAAEGVRQLEDAYYGAVGRAKDLGLEV